MIIEPDEPFTPLWTPEPDAPRERRRALEAAPRREVSP